MSTLPATPLAVSLLTAATLLSISKRTLERQIARGEFPAPLKIGRSCRVELSAVTAYMERLRNQITTKGDAQ